MTSYQLCKQPIEYDIKRKHWEQLILDKYDKYGITLILHIGQKLVLNFISPHVALVLLQSALFAQLPIKTHDV